MCLHTCLSCNGRKCWIEILTLNMEDLKWYRQPFFLASTEQPKQQCFTSTRFILIYKISFKVAFKTPKKLLCLLIAIALPQAASATGGAPSTSQKRGDRWLTCAGSCNAQTGDLFFPLVLFVAMDQTRVVYHGQFTTAQNRPARSSHPSCYHLLGSFTGTLCHVFSIAGLLATSSVTWVTFITVASWKNSVWFETIGVSPSCLCKNHSILEHSLTGSPFWERREVPVTSWLLCFSFAKKTNDPINMT